jgi:hypothetical protein
MSTQHNLNFNNITTPSHTSQKPPTPDAPPQTDDRVLHLDEKYPGMGTIGKVPMVIRVYDSNRTNQENDFLFLQTWGYLTMFAVTSLSCLVYKLFTPEEPIGRNVL